MHIILFIAWLFRISSSEVIVETSSGPIRSIVASTNDVEAFLGVPYAEPPVGELRFAKPVSKKRWEDIYNASTLPPPCAQYSIGPHYFMPDVTNMSEDCLYLNIWMPKAESTRGLRPIIFYIHPGAYATGSSNIMIHDGSHLANRGDVVVVTINYRLGAFGYFLAYTEEANGNMGIYDQIMAMKWVKENAKHFHGDPENIVMMGVSAGAFSISAHMISPLSKNLFKKAIIQSGSIMHPFFMDDNARLFRNSETIASAVGCTNETSTLSSDPRAVVTCLKGKPKEELIDAELNLIKSNPVMFSPRVNDEFLPKNAHTLIREGKFRKDVEVLIGLNENEGTMLMTLLLPEYFGFYGTNQTRTISKHFASALSRGSVLILGQTGTSELISSYFNSNKDRSSSGYAKVVANVIGDSMIACSTIYFADFLSLKGNDVFFYKFDYRSPSTPTAEWMGTTHLDELQYVFGNPYHENFTEEEKEISRRLIDRWSAFARTGNPNIPGHLPWLQYNYSLPIYLNFGQEESIRLKPLDRCELWRNRYNADIDADVIGEFKTHE